MLAVCLFGIGVVPAFAHEGKTARNYPARGADAYVLSRAGGNSSMNVSVDDLMALRSHFSSDFLWFRRSGKEYLVSDRAVIEEAARCFDPLQPLRPEQDALAQRDRALDREEESLDRERDAWDDADDDESRNDVRLDDEHRRDVETRLRAIQEQQRDLERQERILDERQEVLEKAAEAKLDLVIDDALRRGLARPMPGR
jgi:hypothetical protein